MVEPNIVSRPRPRGILARWLSNGDLGWWKCRVDAAAKRRVEKSRVRQLEPNFPAKSSIMLHITKFLLLTAVALPQLALAEDEADQGPGVSLTVYNQNFAIIKERRDMKLAKGRAVVKFPDVAVTIVPESVQFRSLKPADDATVLEQNYEFDLVSANKLLHKYIDRPISVVTRDGGLIEGRLLSSDGAQLVLANDTGVEMVPRGKNVKDIRFSSLPGGLLTRPTLIWKVNSKTAGDHLVKVAYRANGISWRVNYRAVSSADEKSIDLAGWVTITNNTGATFKDAGLKLMAGDLNLVTAPGDPFGDPADARAGYVRRDKGGGGFKEKSFAEYHLYTLGRRTTLANAQTKQIELINLAKIPVTKGYVYRSQYGGRIQTVLEFENKKETNTGLGIPLPKGPFRVYLKDTDGATEFVGADAIDHTPKDEPVRIRLGYAFDIVGERKQTATRGRGSERWQEQDFQIRLRNHKETAVTITVEQPLQGHRNWKILRKSQEFTKRNFRLIEFTAKVPANTEKVITYTVRYTW